MKIKQRLFGRLPEEKDVMEYTLENSKGISASLINYGATITSLKQPDRTGRAVEVTLGFDDLKRYIEPHLYFGGTIGRCANRIAGGNLTIDNMDYTLECNDVLPHHVHGGVKSFYKVYWEAETFEREASAGVVFTYRSIDGEEGYPGNVDVKVSFSLNQEGELRIEYEARTDKPTPVNLTNHAYWNLSGAGSGDITSHILQLNCSKYLPVDEVLIPTGEIADVHGTPLDFTEAKKIGKDLHLVKGGYDHCFIIDRSGPGLTRAARLLEPESGRGLEIITTKPAIHFYSGNFLDGIPGRANEMYNKHDGLCLETEYYPDAVHHPQFPDVILKPGQEYKHTTIYKFFAE
jgi:aldose 1-epimerase